MYLCYKLNKMRVILTGPPGSGKTSIIEELEKRKKLLKVLNSPSNEEVYTSAALVEEMLDKLPVEIWKNKDLTWCDLCSNSGVFMLEVIIRLMKNIDRKDVVINSHLDNLAVAVKALSDKAEA